MTLLPSNKIYIYIYILYIYIYIYIYISFRAGSRSPATFKMKLSVKTIDNSFHLLPAFCHKKLHLIPALNIVT